MQDLAKRAFTAAFLTILPNCAVASEIKVNPITSYELTLLPPTKQEPEPWGWIRLRNGNKDAGYIYLHASKDAPGDPALSSGKEYIITGMPMTALSTLLDILRNEKDLQIRYFDPQSPGVPPWVFIEPRNPPGPSDAGLRADPGFAKFIEEAKRASRK